MQKKSKLVKFTIEDIRGWSPCYDPNRYLSEDWAGTVIDILEHKKIPPQDKLWVVCRENLIDARILRLFAVWCARQSQHLLRDEGGVRSAARIAAWTSWVAAITAGITAGAAARVAAEAAAEAAGAAGRTARAAQIAKLIEMVKESYEEN